MTEMLISDLERHTLVDLNEIAEKHAEYIRKLRVSILLDGLREPVEVGTFNGKTYLLEGHHRVVALKQLGRTSAPVVVNEKWGSR